MDDQHLERRAALTVEGERSEQALLHREFDIRIRQHDGRVLGIEAENGAQPVDLGMHLLEVVGHTARADQRQHIDLAGLKQHRHDLRALAVHRVDDTLRERTAERFEQRLKQQHAELRRLEHHGVAHDECRDQRRERFVERIVVRPHAEHDAKRRAADLADGTFDNGETRVVVIEMLQRLDRRLHVFNRAIKLLLGIRQRLADLPHDEVHDLLAGAPSSAW